MIVVSLSPCMDQTASLPRFCLDAPNRILPERQDLGGKGVNVAKALTVLGESALTVGFDFPGSPVEKSLRDAEVESRLIPLKGKLRVNLKLRETDTGRTIEINEQAAPVTESDLKALENMLLDSCRAGDWVSLSGSLPPGAPADTYARLCARLTEKGCRVAADCDGEPLRCVIKARPALVKPNAQEFAALTGADPENAAAAEKACQGLMARGVGAVCLSLGEKGARLYTPNGVFSCPAAPVKPLGLQGAGDTLLAGLMTALRRGIKEQDALRFASAAAGASVMRPGTLLCRMEDVNALLAADW